MKFPFPTKTPIQKPTPAPAPIQGPRIVGPSFVVAEVLLHRLHEAMHNLDKATMDKDTADKVHASAVQTINELTDALKHVQGLGIDVQDGVRVEKTKNLPPDKQPCKHWDEILAKLKDAN